MPLLKAQSFLVRPRDGSAREPQTDINGTNIEAGDLWDQLSELYSRAEEECTIGIKFKSQPNGRQQNDRRSQLVEYVNVQSIEQGRRIAEHLRDATTNRSGIGLLFLLLGNDPGATLVLARFAMRDGVVARESPEGPLEVEFIREVFMKNVLTYKSVVYRGPAVEGAFWNGKAVDKQLKATGSSSDYWIREFLQSELETSGSAATKQLGRAIRKALKDAPDRSVKAELASFAHLLRNRQGQIVTPFRLAEGNGLSDDAIDALTRAFPRRELMSSTFEFIREEFDKQVGFRYIELDNGARLIAEDEAFNDVFRQDILADNRLRFTTEGEIVSEDLRSLP